MKSGREIWVYAQCRNGRPLPVVDELIGKAQEIAAQIEGSLVAAVVLGENNDAAIEALKKQKIDKVYSLCHRELAVYRCDVYSKAVEQLVRCQKPEFLFFGATAAGSELAPSVAGLLKTGLAAHCIDLRWNGERLNCMVPAFGGKVVSEIYIPHARPVMASVRAGILGTAPNPGDGTAETIEVNAAFLDNIESSEEFLELIPVPQKGDNIEEARVVVAAGRGISTDKAWEVVKEVADKTGGSVAWSRSFIDTGRVSDESCMIGTSGKAIRAELLINAGISGATQFTCGMEKCKTVISINKDPKAKIFEHSDYGVTGDAEKILTGVLARL